MAVQIVREGWLKKQGQVRHNWKKRWFTLNAGKQLSYYDISSKKNHKDTRIHKGTIDLSNAKLVPNHKKHKHGFVLICPDRTWYFAAVDDKDRKAWLGAFEKVLTRTAESKEDLPPDVGVGLAMLNTKDALPDGWEMMKDPNTDRIFYVNHKTKSTQWDRPAAARVEFQTPPTSPADHAPKPSAPRIFTSIIVAGQTVRILKQYKRVAPRTVGQVKVTRADGSVTVGFGNFEVRFEEIEISEWLEPWGDAPRARRIRSASVVPVGQQPFELHFNEGRLGLEFQLVNNTFIVTKVMSAYEASKKGVQVGMLLVCAVDGFGKTVQGSTAPRLADNLSKAPRPLKITFVAGQSVGQQNVYDRQASYSVRRSQSARPAARIV